jgi:hypothetical protein
MKGLCLLVLVGTCLSVSIDECNDSRDSLEFGQSADWNGGFVVDTFRWDQMVADFEEQDFLKDLTIIQVWGQYFELSADARANGRLSTHLRLAQVSTDLVRQGIKRASDCMEGGGDAKACAREATTHVVPQRVDSLRVYSTVWRTSSDRAADAEYMHEALLPNNARWGRQRETNNMGNENLDTRSVAFRCTKRYPGCKEIGIVSPFFASKQKLNEASRHKVISETFSGLCAIVASGGPDAARKAKTDWGNFKKSEAFKSSIGKLVEESKAKAWSWLKEERVCYCW